MKVYYPIFIDLSAKPVIVIGAGKVGMRKIGALVEAGARVTVVSPEALGDLSGAAVDWKRRQYLRGDLQGAFLAYAATGNRSVNAAVTEEARELGIPVKPGRAAAIRDRIREFLSGNRL